MHFSTVRSEAISIKKDASWNESNLRLVDGGSRAIKYTRIGGVQQTIYNEGTIIP